MIIISLNYNANSITISNKYIRKKEIFVVIINYHKI